MSLPHSDSNGFDKDSKTAWDTPVADGLPLKAAPPDVPPSDTWAIFKRYEGEATGSYIKRLCLEGHRLPDAFLTIAASQIGQIMLATPASLWKAGLISGGLFTALAMSGSFFTIYLMNALYVEYKRAKINKGKWGKHTTQYHDLFAFHAGKYVGYAAEVFIILQCLGTGVAQVVACAADWYAVDKSYSKRQLQVFWGAVLQIFIIFPTFRHFRILNILALVGTTYTAIYLLNICRVQGYGWYTGPYRLWPAPNAPTAVPQVTGPQFFFTGTVVILNSLGGHAIATEMIDSMETPQQYTLAYFGGWLWTIFLIIPPSFALNIAFPAQSGAYSVGSTDNVLGLAGIPLSDAKIASVALMILHQLAAYAYYVAPAFFLLERAVGTHNKGYWWKMATRLPLSLGIWLFALAFPFYGAINSLMASISVPFTAFAIPCFTFVYAYSRSHETRSLAPLPPFPFLRAFNWAPIFAVCIFVGFFFLGYGGAAIYYSIKGIADNAKTFGVFAACYQCPANWLSFLKNPDWTV